MKRCLIIGLFMSLLLAFLACQEKKTDVAHKQGIYEVAQQSSCVACHTNKDLLKQVAEPLEGSEGESGEG